MELAVNGAVEPPYVDQCPAPPLPSNSPSLPSKTDTQGVGGSSSPSKSRGRGSLTRVVDKLLARGEPPAFSAPTTAPDPAAAVLSAPVLHKLQKLGTSVEVEVPVLAVPPIAASTPAPATAPTPTLPPLPPPLPSGYQQLMDSLDKAVGLTSDLTRPKKRAHKKPDQVPSTVQLLAEIDTSDSLAKFSFRVDAKQVIELPEGQKLYTCDICSGVYYRGFSLKRHYLKTHINYKHVNKRDLHNCGILFDPSVEKGGSRRKMKDEAPEVVTNLAPPLDIPDLYRCHNCMKCFGSVPDLQAHLIEHPPTSINSPEVYTCSTCGSKFQKKKIYQRHKEECGIIKPPPPPPPPPHAPLLEQTTATLITITSAPPESYSCSDCRAKFDKKKPFLRHREECGISKPPKLSLPSSDAPVESESPPKILVCTSCGEEFQKIRLLLRHEAQCSKKKPLEPSTLSVKKSSTPVRPTYTCATCGVKYRKKKPFIRHRDQCVKPQGPPVPLLCLYCDSTFPTFLLRQQHNLHLHHPKKKLLQCYLCNTKMFRDRLAVLKHLVLHHPEEYFGCLTCRVRFASREELKKHNKVNHRAVVSFKKFNGQAEDEAVVENGVDVQPSNPDLVMMCTECPKMFASVLNMTRHRRLAHRHLFLINKKGLHKKLNVQGSFPQKPEKEVRKSPTPPLPMLNPLPPPSIQVADPEVLFYSTVAHNIRENLTHHLDGKLDSQEVMEYDLNKTAPSRTKVLSFSASFTADSLPSTSTAASIVPATGSNSSTSAASAVASTSELDPACERQTPISPRGQWEKFSFPKNYDGRCGLTSYIRDMSHLDIATQLTMRRNLQRVRGASSVAGAGEGAADAPGDIPSGLLLRERPGPDCAESFGAPSNGDSPNKNKDPETGGVLSGEWVRPRMFICSACGFRSPSLWTVEDHKYSTHPNVWVPHIEIVGEHSSPWDWFYHKRLPPSTVIPATVAVPSSPVSETALCSKCGKTSPSVPDLHRHMLECGGDVGWVGSSLRRRRGRRRRGQGRRGMKRNIPNTPAKHVCGRIRTKPGDMDTIQKMIANLPAKRATRRVLGDELDIKTRSQATISSVPISSLPAHSSAARAAGLKSKLKPKLHSHKRLIEVRVKEEPEERRPPVRPMEAEHMVQHEDILASLEVIPVVRTEPKPIETKEEPAQVEELNVKAEEEPDHEEFEEQQRGSIDTTKILAAMREAMMMETGDKPAVKLDAVDPANRKPTQPVKTEAKSPTKKAKPKKSEKGKKIEMTVKKEVAKETDLIVDRDVIICNGCGMQFENASACHRHKKKCVYWKEEKSGDDKINKCMQCGCIFPYLMALLQHDCGRDDPTMPRLEPEGDRPTTDGVDDLPILSPAGDSSARRMALLETTIREVSDNSFDTLQYYDKLFTAKKPSKIVVKKEPSEKPAKKEHATINKGPLNKNTNKGTNTSVIKASSDKIIPNETAVKNVNIETTVKGINKDPGDKTKRGPIDKPMRKEIPEKVKYPVPAEPIKKESADKAVGTTDFACQELVLMAKEFESSPRFESSDLHQQNSPLVKHTTLRTSKTSPVKRECSQSSAKETSESVLQNISPSVKSKNSTKSIPPDKTECSQNSMEKESNKNIQQNNSTSVKPKTVRTKSKSPVKSEFSHGSVVNETDENTSLKNSPLVKPSTSRTKSISPDKPVRNLKVSDIFKVVKKIRRKRRKRRTTVVRNVLSPRPVLRRKSPVKTVTSAKKCLVNKRTRSSNFVMLMKEWEKLEKEGAIAVGKRKRFSNPEPSEEYTRVTRRRGGQSLNFDLESLMTDTSSVIQDQLILMPRKRTRRSDPLVVTDDEASSETPKDEFKVTTDETEIVPEVVASQDITSRKRKIKNEEEIKSSLDLTGNETEENLVPLMKRRPGRPRFKSITIDVEEHINETIETVLSRVKENRDSDNTKEPLIRSEKNDIPIANSLVKQEGSVDVEKTYNTNEQKEKSLEENANRGENSQVPTVTELDKVNNTIYKVSIGEFGGDYSNDHFIFNTVNSQTLKKRVRSKHVTKTKDSIIKSNTEEKTDSATQLTIPDILNVIEVGEKFKSENENGEKRKLSQTEEEATLSMKTKEIKTKQLSIADYLSISHFIKKSSDIPINSSVSSSLESNTNDKSPCSNAGKELDNETEVLVSMNIPVTTEVSQPSSSQISLESSTLERIQENQSSRNLLEHKDIKQNQADIREFIFEKPSSPSSTSSKEDLSLSVIRAKAIEKKKNRKMKLKKLLKNKSLEHIDVASNKPSKSTKLKVPFKAEKLSIKDKLKKRKVRVGVSWNRWEVSVVENNKSPVEVACEEEKQAPPAKEPGKIFYCAICDMKFESSYSLYQHQLTSEHKAKVKAESTSQAGGSQDDADPVKYCKSIGNIINDLEKRTLNVAKVMHQLKHQPDGTTAVAAAAATATVAASSTGVSPGNECVGVAAAPGVVVDERWEGHNTPPWDDTASLGSIMDTVNRLLDQETPPGYSWADLQLAMGASDEEMAVLEQLGETTLQEEYNNAYNTLVEEPPSLIDLDQPEGVPSPTPSPSAAPPPPPTTTVPTFASAPVQFAEPPSEARKLEPVEIDINLQESKACRSSRPRHLLGEYEAREMVCPTCNKHFFGLAALEAHLAWAHSALPSNSCKTTALQNKRNSLLAMEEVDRRRVCFICQEMVASPSLLEAHIRESHAKEVSQDTAISETAEKLKSKMSLALGGLVDRALNKMLGGALRSAASPTPSPSPSSSPAHFATPAAAQPDFNSGALQLLGRLCAVKKRVGNDNIRLSADTLQLLGRLRTLSAKEPTCGRVYSSALAHEVRQVLSRTRPPAVSKTALQASVTNATAGGTELKPTNLLDHLAVCSADVTQRPYACPICDLRFLIPSTRNRHIARAHGKYGHRYDTDEDSSNQELDYGWKEVLDSGMEASDETQILPLCSDCGLSFQSIHEVMQHRIEDHPRRFSADCLQEDKPGLTIEKHSVVESSSETVQPFDTKSDDIRLLPVSDNAIDSTSTAKKKKGSRVSESKPDQRTNTTNPEGKASSNRKRKAGDSEESQTTIDGDDESLCSENTEADKHSNGHSSEENLAELSKKLDRRKVRTGNLGEVAVKEKAEAALRELSRKKQSSSPGAKWGATAMKFTKHQPQPDRARFTGLGDKRWRLDLPPRTELIDVKPDIYDFREDDGDQTKRPAVWVGSASTSGKSPQNSKASNDGS